MLSEGQRQFHHCCISVFQREVITVFPYALIHILRVLSKEVSAVAKEYS